MKKTILLLVSILIMSLISGCSNNDGDVTTDDGYKIAYTAQTLANPYFITIVEGLKEYALEKDIELLIGDGNQDAAKQVSQIENFIAQEVDAIIISPVNDQALASVIKQAKEKGIVVIGANQDVPDSDAFITVPEYEYGYSIGKVAGEWIAKEMDGEAEVLVLDYPEIEAIIARGDGIREGILEFAPNAVIVKSISANTPEKGMAAMELILQTNPNVQVVVGVNDAGVLGAFEAVMAANKATEKFFMGGLDATDQAKEKIKEGSIYRATIDINPAGTGKLFLDTAIKVIENGPIEEVISIEMIPVTIENVSQFLD